MKTMTFAALLVALAPPASADIENGYYVTQLLPTQPGLLVRAAALNDHGEVIGTQYGTGEDVPVTWNPVPFDSAASGRSISFQSEGDSGASGIGILDNGDLLLQNNGGGNINVQCNGYTYVAIIVAGNPLLNPADCTEFSSAGVGEILVNFGWPGPTLTTNDVGQYIVNDPDTGTAFLYTPVPGTPEPSSLLLLGTILGGSLLFRLKAIRTKRGQRTNGGVDPKIETRKL